MNVLEAILLGVIISISLWPSYLAIKFQGVPNISITRILIFLAIVLWISVLLVKSSYQSRFINFFKTYWVFLLLILIPFFGWKLITAWLSYNRMPSVFSALKDTTYCLALFFVAINVWNSFIQLKRVIKVLVFSSVIVFFIVLVESLLQQNLFIHVVPASFVSSHRLVEGIIRDGVYRVWGPFSHPLALANYCTTVLPLVVWYACCHNGKRRMIGFFTCAALLVTLYLSTSRGGLVVLIFMTAGFMITTCLPEMLKRVKKNQVGLALVLSIIISIITLVGAKSMGEKLISGRTAKEAGSSSIRLLQMELGIPLIIDRPIIGYGPGEAAEVLGLKAKTIDNYYLSLAIESGLPELVLFILILLYFLRYAWKLHNKLPPPQSALAIAIFWSIAGNALFLTVLSLEQVMPLMFLIFSMLIVLRSDQIISLANKRSGRL